MWPVARAAAWPCAWLIACLVAFTAPAAAQSPAGADASPGPGAAAPGSVAPGASAVGVVPAARLASNVVVITIEGPITATTERSFKRRLAEAEAGAADAVVVELNTPGGELGAVLEISRAIKGSSIANTVAWVRPNAFSGGAIVALACREIIATPGAVMGDALIIAVSRMGQINALPEAERQKLLAPLLVDITNSARLRGYDEKLVQGFVSLGVELWLVESVKEPGRLLFITRDEYATIFGAEPGAMTPSVPSAPAAPRDAGQSAGSPPTGAGGMSADGLPVQPAMRARPRRGGSGGIGGPAGATPGAVDPSASPLAPAIPGLSPAVARTISAGLVGKSARPVLTAADRGQWTLVEYVSDGRGILTLNDAQLLRYALASPGNAAGGGAGTVSSDEDLKAFFQAKRLVRLDQSVAETIAGWLSGTLVRAVLVVMVLVGIFLEIAAPGFIIGSLLAMVGILGLAGPMIIFGLAGWWWALSVLAGAVLIAVEIFLLPGFGVFGLAGLLALFGGLVGLVAPRSVSFDSAGETSGVLTALATVLVATLVAGVIVYFVARNFSTIPLLGRLVLGPGEPSAPTPGPGDAAGPGGTGGGAGTGAVLRVGAEGVVVTALRPSGKARFGDELVDVVSAGGLVPPGASVRVVEVSAFRVSVEAVRTM